MLRCKTIIAKGSPNKAGSSDSHGSPLGEQEFYKKSHSQLAYDAFEIPSEVYEYFREDDQRRTEVRETWLDTLSEHPRSEEFCLAFQSLQIDACNFHLLNKVKKLQLVLSLKRSFNLFLPKFLH